MSDDPIVRIARLRIIKMSAELEADLATKQRGNIAIEMLNRLRTRAAESLAALATHDVTGEDGIKGLILLQNEVKRYDEWVTWMHEILREGRQYDKQMGDQDREEMLDYLTATPEGQQQAIELGLIDTEMTD